MAIWIGVDEAGYGPNLGPLSICGTVWQIADDFPTNDWNTRLAAIIRRVDDGESGAKLVVDDSKKVYQSGKGLAALEHHVLTLLQMSGATTVDTSQLLHHLDPNSTSWSADVPWRRETPSSLPCSDAVIYDAAGLLEIASALRGAGIEIKKVAGRFIYPREFNQRLSRCDNKAAVLSEATIELVCGLLSGFKSEDVLLHCDKHGGRDRYFALLTHFFPDERIEIVTEGEEESVYRWRQGKRRVEIRFCAKGERHLPTAAASMTAKYVRELCMAEWNAFWQAQIPGLAPTAGYPLDARRFRKAIDRHVSDFGWPEQVFWRLK